MKNIFTLIIGMIIYVCVDGQNPQLKWDENYNGPVSGTDRITDSDFDPINGYTYVTGVSDSTTGYNYVTIKYSSDGQVIWRKRYSGPQSQDSPNAIKYDPVNNAVYVAGKSRGTTTNSDWLTIRYNAATGDIVWTKTYNGDENGDDEAIDLDIDASGNIYVVGNVLESCNNHLTTKIIKYSPVGNVTWTKSIYDYMCRYEELASKVAVSGNKVVVIYNVHKDSYYYAYAIGYFISNGNCTDYMCRNAFIGVNTTALASYGVTFDGLGNVYLSGGQETATSGYMQVSKLETNVYSIVWAEIYGWPEPGVYWANNIIVDQNNYYVYVTGYSHNSSGNNDIITIKYNNLGDTIWTKKFNGVGNGDDRGMFIAKDNLTNPNIFVTGYTIQTSGKKQITTIKYDNSGNQLWSMDYGCSANDNIPVSMFRDPNDNLYIAGFNNCNSSNEDFLTLRYSILPVQPGAITGEVSPCAGSSQTYSITQVSGATSYTWTLPSGWSGSSTTNSITVTVGSNSGSICVTANNGSYASSEQCLSVSPLNKPDQPGTISGEDTICEGSNQTYSIVDVSGATSYTWSYSGGGSPSGTGTSCNLTPTSSGILSVTAKNSCGASTVRTIALVVISKPSQPGTLSGETYPCVGSPQVYSIDIVSGATSYTWSVPADWSGSDTTNSISAVVRITGGDICVTANNVCGNSPSKCVLVSPVDSVSQPGSISGETNPCTNFEQIYSVNPVQGATSYEWELPEDWTGKSITNTINVTMGRDSGNLCVKAVNQCGSSVEHCIIVQPKYCPCIPPVPPSGVVASDGLVMGEITITWEPVSDANSYIIYRDGDSIETRTASQNYYTDYSAPCKVITYEVYASNGRCKSEDAGNDTGYGLNCGGTTSVNNISAELYSVYPNPVTHQLIVELNEVSTVPTKIEIYNVLHQEMLNIPVNEGKIQLINVSSLKPGLYFIRLSWNNRFVTEKFIIEE